MYGSVFTYIQSVPFLGMREAITADFDRISTNNKDYITFNYVLRNNTGKDYSLTNMVPTFITRLDGSLSQTMIF